MKDRFFVYCNESGFDCFETLDEALDEASERTQEYLVDGWSEEVTSVCVGKITHRAKMCDQVFPDGEIDEDGLDEAGDYWDPDWEYKCNYKVLTVEHATDGVMETTPEIAKLVESLEVAHRFIANGIELGYIQMPDSDTLDAAHETLPAIEAALAEYRAQGGDV